MVSGKKVVILFFCLFWGLFLFCCWSNHLKNLVKKKKNTCFFWFLRERKTCCLISCLREPKLFIYFFFNWPHASESRVRVWDLFYSPPPPKGHACFLFEKQWTCVEFFSKGFTVVFGKKEGFSPKKTLSVKKKLFFSKTTVNLYHKKPLTWGGALTSLFFFKEISLSSKTVTGVIIGSENKQSLEGVGGVVCK